MSRTRIRLVVVGALLMLIAACGGESSTSSTTSPTTTPGDEDSTTTTTASESSETTVGEDEEFDAEAYFTGRTINMAVSEGVGGGTDLMARLVADNLSDLIPGQPTINVTNLSGQAGMQVVYDAPEDEIFLGASSNGASLYDPVLNPEFEYDPTQVSIFGALAADPRGAVALGEWAQEYDGLLDAQGGGPVPLRAGLTIGAPGDVAGEAMLYPLVCDGLELNCEIIVISVDSGADHSLMLERGEINSDVSSLSGIGRDFNEGLLDGTVDVLWLIDAETADISWPDTIPQAPNLAEVLPDEQLEIFEVIRPSVSGGGFNRPYWVGPNVSDEVVAVLQQAWNDFIADPDRFGEYETLASGGSVEEGIQITPAAITGEEATSIYVEQATSLLDNLDYFQELQEDWFERYYR